MFREQCSHWVNYASGEDSRRKENKEGGDDGKDELKPCS